MEDIKKFSDFFESKDKEFEQEPLSDDIIKIEVDDIEKMKGEWEIDAIIDVITDTNEAIEKFGYDFVMEAGGGSAAIGTHADLSVKEVKRGQTMYITALLRKRGTTSFNAQAVQGVLKVRVVDIYYGLQYLKKALNT